MDIDNVEPSMFDFFGIIVEKIQASLSFGSSPYLPKFITFYSAC